MQAFLMVVHVLLAIALIALILVQHGRGADAGAAFGSGASSTVFGARGSGSFLTKITTLLAIAFFANSLGLAYLSAQLPNDTSLMDSHQVEVKGAEQEMFMAPDSEEQSITESEEPVVVTEPAVEEPAGTPAAD